jgi:hypothetical protein
MFSKKYELYISGNAFMLYPCEQHYGYISFKDGKRLNVPFSYSYSQRWGDASSLHILGNGNMFEMPDSIDMAWLSIVENKFYEVHASLPKERLKELLDMKDTKTKEQIFSRIVVGMTPYGSLAIWLSGLDSYGTYTTEIAWLQGEEADIDFYVHNRGSDETIEEYCEWQLRVNKKRAYENFLQNGLPDRELFNNYMKKFEYRIVPVLKNKDIDFYVPYIHYYSGEFFMVRCNREEYNIEKNFMRYDTYQPKAKPYKINIKWEDGKDEYDGYFWTDEKKIIETFSTVFGGNPQTKGDFVIEIGEDYKTFRFFLRNDDIEIEIPESDMEIMIFKNKRESYRNENYKRPDEGWMN